VFRALENIRIENLCMNDAVISARVTVQLDLDPPAELFWSQATVHESLLIQCGLDSAIGDLRQQAEQMRDTECGVPDLIP
jgi:hypothetical protein